ncbi:MAG: thioredoxin [Odoribacter sp.]|nr:thioredoxin [Odoribacter sp.]
MKTVSFLIILIPVCFAGCKTTKPAAEISQQEIAAQVPVTGIVPSRINFSDQATWLLGYFSIDRLRQEPHSAWFISGYDEYQINTEPLNKLLEISNDNLTIKIVLGTWCPDSRREVPKFIRILDIWRFPVSKVNFIGVDNAKLSPVGEYESLVIQRVPTFIIYKNNIEVGRIIENPVTSLEQDMVNILALKE